MSLPQLKIRIPTRGWLLSTRTNSDDVGVKRGTIVDDKRKSQMISFGCMGFCFADGRVLPLSVGLYHWRSMRRIRRAFWRATLPGAILHRPRIPPALASPQRNRSALLVTKSASALSVSSGNPAGGRPLTSRLGPFVASAGLWSHYFQWRTMPSMLL